MIQSYGKIRKIVFGKIIYILAFDVCVCVGYCWIYYSLRSLQLICLWNVMKQLLAFWQTKEVADTIQ